MDKLAANISKGGTFLFRAPADNEPITKRQIRNNMVAWIFDPRDAYEYVTLLQVERFVFTKDEKQESIYVDDENQPEEISKDDAKNIYTLMNELLEQKQKRKEPPVQKVNK